MYLRNFTLIAIFFFVTCSIAYSQEYSDKEFSFPTPEAASLGKYGDIPVGYNTGSISQNIPIYTVQENSIQLPISLSYHSGGIKVEETGTAIGLGWSLQAGGMITRTVRGAPDEGGKLSQLSGYYKDHGHYCPPIPCSDDDIFGDDVIETPFGDWTCGQVTNFALDQIMDTEPDLFSFNFSGFSGKFLFDKNRNVHLIPQQDLKVEVQTDWVNHGGLSLLQFQTFIITSPEGVKYYFGGQYLDSTASALKMNGEIPDPFLDKWSVSNWHLYKIENATGSEKIELEYGVERYAYTNTTPESGQYTTCRGAEIWNQPSNPNAQKTLVRGHYLSKIKGSQMEIILHQENEPRKDLSKYSKRFDSTPISTKWYDPKAISNIEIKTTSGICYKNIELKHNWIEAADYQYASSWQIPQDESDKFRLYLTGIQEKACNGAEGKQWSFTYFNPEELPRRFSYAQDHWGYYNGQTQNKRMMPKILNIHTNQPNLYQFGDSFYGSANRNPSFPEMSYGTLSSISFPTGGNVELTYEPHTYSYLDTNATRDILLSRSDAENNGHEIIYWGEFEFTTNLVEKGYVEIKGGPTGENRHFISYLEHLATGQQYIFTLSNQDFRVFSLSERNMPAGTYSVSTKCLEGSGTVSVYQLDRTPHVKEKTAGGLRIAKIDKIDPLTGKTITTEFDYIDASGSSTGRLIGFPQYAAILKSELTTELEAEWGWGEYVPCNEMTGEGRRYVTSSSNAAPLQHIQGSHMIYASVKVSKPGAGYNLYQYNVDHPHNILDNPHYQTMNFGINTNYPFVEPPYLPGLGNLERNAVFNQDGQILEENWTFYKYSTSNILISNTNQGDAFKTGYFPNSSRSVFNFYSQKTGYAVPEHIISKKFNTETGDIYTIESTLHYGNKHLNPIQIDTLYSDGSVYSDQIIYLYDVIDELDLTSDDPLAVLASQNKNVVLEKRKFLTDEQGVEKTFEAMGFEFEDFGYKSNVHLSNINRLETNSSITDFTPLHVSGGELITDSRLTPYMQLQYDNQGRQIDIQQGDKMNMHIHYTPWVQQPVAMLKNAKVGEYQYNSFDNQTEIGIAGAAKHIDHDYQNNMPIPLSLSNKKMTLSFWVKSTGAESKLELTIEQLSNGSVISEIDPEVIIVKDQWVLIERNIQLDKVSAGQTLQLKVKKQKGNLLLDELRIQPTKSLMLTANYNEFNSIQSLRSDRGEVVNYYYNIFNQLEQIIDSKGNVKQIIDYQYPSSSHPQAFVRTYQANTPGLRNMYEVLTAPEKDVQQTTQFVDGFGNPIQTVKRNGASMGKDLVQVIGYDELGRQNRTYLPFTQSASGEFVNNALNQVFAHWELGIVDGNTTEFPFEEMQYERSPRSLVVSKTQAGDAWQNNAEIIVSYPSTETITAIVQNQPAVFAPGELWVEKSTDSEGKQSWQYIDKMGKVLLTIHGTDNPRKQYFSYTLQGQVQTIYPPKAADILQSNGFNLSDEALDPYIYEYTYNAKGLLQTKKLASQECTWHYYYNDREMQILNACIAQAESEVNAQFTKYDALDRVIIEGEKQMTLPIEMPSNLKMWENESEDDLGYTNQSYPILDGSEKINNVIYFDHYDFNHDQTEDISASDVEDEKQAASAKGLVTKSIERIIDPSAVKAERLKQTFFYNDNDQVIQLLVEYQNHTNRISNTYDNFRNLLLSTQLEHSGQENLTVKQRNEYDYLNRLKATYVQVNNQPELLESTLEYNALGRIVRKKQHHTGELDGVQTFLQQIDYTYNIQGWLEQINNPFAISNSGSKNGKPTINNEAQDDVFALKLLYQNQDNVVQNQPKLDGRVTGQIWKNSQGVHAYSYLYDEFNQITEANYSDLTFTSSWEIDLNEGYSTEYTYDKQGNITSLVRNAFMDVSSNSTPVLIAENMDQLQYRYKGNRLHIVNDAAADFGPNNPKGFTELVQADINNPSSRPEYSYDKKGNIIQDRNKGIEITYNHLNLPMEISWTDENKKIQIVYSASGTKLSQTSIENGQELEKREYFGAIEYVNGELEGFYHENGRLVKTTNGMQPEYQITDHLGNIRVRYTDLDLNGEPEVLEEKSYYPFGLAIEDGSAILNQNNYGFQGKELNAMFGVNLQDFGARMYDPTLAVWQNIDPLAEKFTQVSPYNFVMNSPLSLIDPDGMAPKDPKEKKENATGNSPGKIEFTLSSENVGSPKTVTFDIKYDTDGNLTLSSTNNIRGQYGLAFAEIEGEGDIKVAKDGSIGGFYEGKMKLGAGSIQKIFGIEVGAETYLELPLTIGFKIHETKPAEFSINLGNVTANAELCVGPLKVEGSLDLYQTYNTVKRNISNMSYSDGRSSWSLNLKNLIATGKSYLSRIYKVPCY